MAKVTVVTVPEEFLPELEAERPPMAAKPQRRKLDWKKGAGKLRQFVLQLFYRNWPLSILAVLLSRLTILGEMSPFGLALFAAVAQVSRERAGVVAFWAVAGVVSAGNYHQAGVYLLAVLLYFRWQSSLTRFHRKILAVPLLMFCSIIAGGLALSFWEQGTLYDGMTVVFNAAICLIASCLFIYGVPLLLDKSRISAQTANEGLVCLLLMMALAVAGFGGLTIFEYSLRNIAGSLLVLLLALGGGAGLGAAAGVAVGFVSGLHDGNVPLAISLYAAAGAIGGALQGWGKYAVILGFILGSAVINLCFTQLTLLTQALLETALAGALFLFIPAGRMIVLQEHFNAGGPETAACAPPEEAAGKMQHIAAMFNELADEFGVIATNSQARLRDDELAKVLTAVGEQVCERCERRTRCWEQDFYRTYQAMLDMLGQAEHTGLSVNTMTGVLKEHCVRRQELIDIVGSVAEKNKSGSYWQKKMFEHRQLVTEQMKATGIIIHNLAQEISRQPQSDRELAAELKSRAALGNCRLEQVRVTGENGGRVIEACKQPCSGSRECIRQVLPLAAAVAGDKLMLQAECGNKARRQKCRLTMQVAKRFSVESGVASAAKEEQSVCGDTCAVVPLNKGRIALMLSDGMGSGSKAAGESAMAVRFLEKLLAVGFDVNVAVRTVNSLLLLREPAESFATVDMAIVDTYSGETEFLKVASAPSFIKRVREVKTIQSASLPMGILNQIEIEPVRANLVNGDILVMISDGIADIPQRKTEKESWLANFLRRTDILAPQQLADRILQEAIDLSGGYVRDDMTVVVARITERNELNA